VHCSVLQSVAVCCSAMQCVAVRCSMLQRAAVKAPVISEGSCHANTGVCCSVLHENAVVICCGVLQSRQSQAKAAAMSVAVCQQCIAVCVAMCCSVLQCVVLERQLVTIL